MIVNNLNVKNQYDSMIYNILPHGTEVIFIRMENNKEIIYEDFFNHHDVKKISDEYIKKE